MLKFYNFSELKLIFQFLDVNFPLSTLVNKFREKTWADKGNPKRKVGSKGNEMGGDGIYIGT